MHVGTLRQISTGPRLFWRVLRDILGAEAVRGCPWRGTRGSMSAGAPFSGLPFLAGESVASFLLNINALFCWSRPASAGHSRSPSNLFVGLVVFFLFVGPFCA